MLPLPMLSSTCALIAKCNTMGYLITATLETHKITDLVGTGAFVLAVTNMSYQNGLIDYLLSGNCHFRDIARNEHLLKVLLVNSGIAVWGTRLASFLFYRVCKVGEDSRLRSFFRHDGERYLDLKKSFFPIKLSSFWMIQSLWGIICLLPVTFFNATKIDPSSGVVEKTSDSIMSLLGVSEASTPLLKTALTALPLGLMFTGIAVEIVADYQKNRYRNDKRNDGHWCDQGLWAYSRYPNYFGEILTWWSVYFACLPHLTPTTALVSLASPSFITFLLMKLSGVPLLENKNKKLYGDNAEFQQYCRSTNLLVPLPKFSDPSDASKKQ